jgi:hypothetical protein
MAATRNPVSGAKPHTSHRYRSSLVRLVPIAITTGRYQGSACRRVQDGMADGPAPTGGSPEPARRPKVLVSNDDGIKAPGIKALVAELLKQDFCDVTVCAPSSERSAQVGAWGACMHNPLQRIHGLDCRAGDPKGLHMHGGSMQRCCCHHHDAQCQAQITTAGCWRSPCRAVPCRAVPCRE